MTFFTLSTQVSGGGRCDLPESRSLPRRLRTDRLPLACELLRFGDLRWGHLANDLEAGLRKRRAVRARVRALWGLSGWRGNERIFARSAMIKSGYGERASENSAGAQLMRQ
jgi:hypothetical protein